MSTYTHAQEGGLILGDPIPEKNKQILPLGDETEMGLKEQPVLKSKAPEAETKQNTSMEQNETIQKSPLKKVVKPNTVEDKKDVQENEESVLTFNFLYYIIQKFKFEEVIDQ